MSELPVAKKSLGQHWLTEPSALMAMCEAAEIGASDIVLEIGPGIGTLTKFLTEQAKRVVAVELDESLARALPGQVPAPNLEIITGDILQFDFSQLPVGYKVIANIPYYLTSHLLRILSETTNPPALVTLLVQKEIAERVTAEPGEMSLLGVTAQYYWRTNKGIIVPARLFNPSPKVNSQILVLKRRLKRQLPESEEKEFFRLVKAGFSSRRKTLLNSLSGGLRLGKEQVQAALEDARIRPDLRAQALSLSDWYQLFQSFHAQKFL